MFKCLTNIQKVQNYWVTEIKFEENFNGSIIITCNKFMTYRRAINIHSEPILTLTWLPFAKQRRNKSLNWLKKVAHQRNSLLCITWICTLGRKHWICIWGRKRRRRWEKGVSLRPLQFLCRRHLRLHLRSPPWSLLLCSERGARERGAKDWGRAQSLLLRCERGASEREEQKIKERMRAEGREDALFWSRERGGFEESTIPAKKERLH
jgi:hypothetical protein